MLLDHYLPEYDVAEHHSIYVNAAPDLTYQAILATPLDSSFIVRVLLRLRSLPSELLRKNCDAANREGATILDLIGNGFFLIDDNPGREIVVGTIGRFWTTSGGGISNARADDIEKPLPSGTALALWNFRVVRQSNGCVVHTETRVRCADDAARRSFRRYWRLIGPFSALIRREMLKSVKYEAESAES